MKLTIKKRIVLWYTVWMLILLAGVLTLLLLSGDLVMARRAKQNLQEVVSDAVDEIEYEHGRLKIDDDISFFDDGVYVQLFDGGFASIAGRLPSDLPSVAFQHGRISTASNKDGRWYVYDHQMLFSHDSSIWVRGVTGASDFRSLFDSMQLLILACLPLLILLAGLGGYWIVRGAFRPFKKMVATAEAIADGGDLSKRIDLPDGTDEIHAMAQTFDKMLGRLEDSFEKEKRFTSDASHELRTPIATIHAQCEYALEHADDPVEMEAALKVILRQSSRMSGLVSQLLTLARADRQQAQVTFERINLSELAELSLASLEEMAQERNIRMESDIEAGIFASVDQTLMTRLLMNLLGNAISYGKEGGWVRLGLSVRNGLAVMEISDDGIGISSEHLPKIWDRFYQVDPSRTAANGDGSLGLGLSMVRWIVQTHGGRISVESVPDIGSRFTVEIPIERK